jgi:regulator of protease activity HflC (stomatin/prohibitin superfamily)
MTSVCCCYTKVPQAYVGILESFGKFDSVIPPGCHFTGCTTECKGLLSLRLQRFDVNVQTNSKERTEVWLRVVIFFRPIPSKSPTAFYGMAGIKTQLKSFAEAAIRSEALHFTVEQLFAVRDELSHAVRANLGAMVAQYGYEITDALILHVSLPPNVAAAFSLQAENRYTRAAADAKGDIERIKRTIAAEANAEVQRLSGVGQANQRIGAMGSLGDLLQRFSDGDQSDEMMATILAQQYLDSLEAMSKAKGTHTVLVPLHANAIPSLNNPASLSLTGQLMPMSRAAGGGGGSFGAAGSKEEPLVPGPLPGALTPEVSL